MKHANISIFIPHLGCSNQCSFCNQHAITGSVVPPTKEDVMRACETAIIHRGDASGATEIAFFGGSFTAIDRDYMVMLLETASVYIKSGVFKGIRISTRPDAIDRETLLLLKKYGVTAIELGAQSMNEEVLRLNDRNHTASSVVTAAGLIKAHGFELGLQMMTGLYGDDDDGALYTAKMLSGLKPDTVRIYPTIVLKGTKLEKLYLSGQYMPQTLEGAVALCTRLLEYFRELNIPVIRLGLHTINESDYIGGPWHAAFRELCEGEIYYRNAVELLSKSGLQGEVILFVNGVALSKMIGQNKVNLERLKAIGYDVKVKADDELSEYEIRAIWGEGSKNATKDN